MAGRFYVHGIAPIPVIVGPRHQRQIAGHGEGVLAVGAKGDAGRGWGWGRGIGDERRSPAR